MKIEGGTPILTTLKVVHQSNINTVFEANPCSSLRNESCYISY